MVRITTSVAPKLRARSLRRVESNNIVAISEPDCIMDFRHSASRLRRAGRRRRPMRCSSSSPAMRCRSGVGRAAGARCSPTRSTHGDLALKTGPLALPRTGRPASKAPRLVVRRAPATRRRRRSRRRSAAGLGALKGAGRQAPSRCASAGAGASATRTPRRWSRAVGDAVYLYRHTKPSAAPAPKLAQVTLLVRARPKRRRCSRACSAAPRSRPA